MKKVTTNMTIGQILFVLFILMVSSLMFFYLGAKFGGDIMTLSEQQQQEAQEPFLPDDKLATEIEAIMALHKDKLVFHDVVQERQSIQSLKPSVEKRASGDTAVVLDREGEMKLPGQADEKSEKEISAKVATEYQGGTSTSRNIAKVATKIADDMAQKVFMPEAASAAPVIKVAKVEQPVAPAKIITKAPEEKKVAVKTQVEPEEEKLNVILPKEKPVEKVVTPPVDTSRYVLPSSMAQAQPTTPVATPASFNPSAMAATPQPNTVSESVQTELQTPALSSGGKSYRLQIGSYAQKDRALQAKSEWERRGYPVTLIQTNIPGKGTWFRLQVGHYSTLSDVQSAQQRIMQDFQQTAMILPVGN